VENGRIERHEVRDKLGHMHLGWKHGHEDDPRHHYGPEADHRQRQMIDPIADCEVLVAGGNGRRFHAESTLSQHSPRYDRHQIVR